MPTIPNRGGPGGPGGRRLRGARTARRRRRLAPAVGQGARVRRTGLVLVVANGAAPARDHGHYRVFIDPVGHPFCLYQGHGPAALVRVVYDCFSPRSLARFWSALLDLPDRVVDTPERVVIAGPYGPELAFQHAPGYVAPAGPTPPTPSNCTST